jgi:uncharacterized protein YecT (DUF1311 family)
MKPLYTIFLCIITMFTSDVSSMEQSTTPRNILHDMVLPPTNLVEPSGVIQEAVYIYRNLESFDEGSHESFVSLLSQAKEQLEQALSNASVKIAVARPNLQPSLKSTLNSIERKSDQLFSWAVEDLSDYRAQIFRLVYSTAKLIEISEIIEKENAKYRFSLSPYSLWNGLKIQLPCELYIQYPNSSIDAFFSTIFDGEGQYNTESAIAEIVRLPFFCPLKEFESYSNIQAGLSDYLDIYRYTKEDVSEEWFERLFNEEDSNIIKNSSGFPAIYDYKTAMDTLSESDDPYDILLLALLKHTFSDVDDGEEIASMLDSIDFEIQDEGAANFKLDHGYDGSDGSMIGYLRHHSQNGTGGRAYFTIPCGVVIARPGLLSATSPYYFSNRDNFLPRTDCQSTDYPLPESVNKYIKLVGLPEGNWLGGHTGSARYGYYKRRINKDLVVRAFPSKLLKHSFSKPDHSPYETWSYLNITNRMIYEDLKRVYEAALNDLQVHYSDHFSLSDDDALRASEIALWSFVDESHWARPPRSGLRFMILENYPIEAIKAEIAKVDDLSDAEHSLIAMKGYSPAWSYVGFPDSLLSMSVDRPEVLSLLLHKKNSFIASEKEPLSHYSAAYNNPATDVNTKSRIGKTALHSAIQVNNHESVKLLLSSGADISATVDGDLLHNKRSVAMYAASYGDLNMIKLLLESGVDFSGADSRGQEVIGYLLGFGSLDPNPHVKQDSFAEYLKLLKPGLLKNNTSEISPSFDCNKAARYSESAVCNDVLLSTLDRFVSVKYRSLRNTISDGNSLRNSQRKWLKERDECKEYSCILSAYQLRLKELKSYTTYGSVTSPTRQQVNLN